MTKVRTLLSAGGGDKEREENKKIAKFQIVWFVQNVQMPLLRFLHKNVLIRWGPFQRHTNEITKVNEILRKMEKDMM